MINDFDLCFYDHCESLSHQWAGICGCSREELRSYLLSKLPNLQKNYNPGRGGYTTYIRTSLVGYLRNYWRGTGVNRRRYEIYQGYSRLKRQGLNLDKICTQLRVCRGELEDVIANPPQFTQQLGETTRTQPVDPKALKFLADLPPDLFELAYRALVDREPIPQDQQEKVQQLVAECVRKFPGVEYTLS